MFLITIRTNVAKAFMILFQVGIYHFRMQYIYWSVVLDFGWPLVIIYIIMYNLPTYDI